MPAISLKQVSLDYPVLTGSRSFRRDLMSIATGGTIRSSGKQTTVRALDDVSFELHEGERLGLLGHNGAGKSTLLKLLAGIYPASAGELRVRGRVSTLFTTSPGLDPDDTGYEIIKTCGMFLGMSRREIERKTQDIAEFSGLGEFLNLPARTYSAGMTMRLSFSIATAIDPDILIIDEGLGAGDANFAEKASARMHAMIDRSNVVVFASHSIELLRAICNKAALLVHGRIVAFGDIESVVDTYQRLNHP
jgi:ABC-type polysaccharide/polyol phosphate transport system, ATPase component